MKTISGIIKKKALHILSSVAVTVGLAALAGGCYDDSYILDQLNKHEILIQQLEKQCSEMNTNISSLQTIVTALGNNDFVTGIEPVVENGVNIGYTITFSKSGSVTIYHGKNGKDGVDGAKGKDGVTPQLRITSDYWYISYDDGASWTRLGRATGEDGEDGIDGKDGADGVDGHDGADGTSFFKAVTVNDTTIELTLSDANSTVIVLNRALPLDIKFYDSDLGDKQLIDPGELLAVTPGSTISIYFEVTADDAADIMIDAVGSSQVKAIVVTQAADKNRKGRIDIQIGPTINDYSKVSVFVSDGTTLIVKTFQFI